MPKRSFRQIYDLGRRSDTNIYFYTFRWTILLVSHKDYFYSRRNENPTCMNLALFSGLCLWFVCLLLLHILIGMGVLESLLKPTLTTPTGDLKWILFLAVLGIHCYTGFSLVVVSGGLLFVGMHKLLCCSGFSSCRARVLGVQASVVAARGPSRCGSQAQEHRLGSCGACAY